MAVCSDFINPWDLQCWIVNVFAGDWKIFAIIILVAIISLAAMFKMPTATLGLSILLFSVIFAGELPWLWFIALLVSLIVIFFIIARVLKS